MTATSDDRAAVVPTDHIKATIDDIEVVVPKGTLVIRAAEEIGIEIPRFCDHPLLDPVAACRMCLIDIKGMPKPQPACAIPLTDGMEVHTQLTSPVADAAQKGVMEFLLINHPLDCPVCDKGGECPLQNQAMTAGRGSSRFDGTKRTFPKPINVSAQILLDRERCVSCARCTRFAEQIAGDDFISLQQRGAQQQIGIAPGVPFNSYFSGNTVQICPVGALTSAGYRFRSRPFDLVSTPTACEHCASGCAMRTDARRGTVMRRLAGDDPEVNEEWNCDKGRFAFPYLERNRLTTPLIRAVDGQFEVASWPEAIDYAAEQLQAARGSAAVLTGGRLTREDAYLYGKFARVALHTDDIDFRSRPTSEEERDFLAAAVAGTGLGVTYTDLAAAPIVVLVGLEPEEESPVIFLRLRKATQSGKGPKVVAIAAWESPGFRKTAAVMIPTIPGDEPAALAELTDPTTAGDIADLLRQPGAVILAGERLSEVPGGFTAVLELAKTTGAQVAWVPRRAGERGALDAGALAGLLPGGRPVADAGARAEVAAAWGLASDALPATPGRDITTVLAALAAPPELDEDEQPLPPPFTALVLGGMELADFPDPDTAADALAAAPFVVALATHPTDVTALADVVFPVQVDTERSGSYTDWEGRVRHFGTVFPDAAGYTDGQVLALLAHEIGAPIGAPVAPSAAAAAELDQLGDWDDERAEFVARPAAPVTVQSGQAVLATWRHLLDNSLMASGEPYLAATARPVLARMSAATAVAFGVTDGGHATVSTADGSITLPVEVTEMPDFTVWLPTNSPGCDVHSALHASAGSIVSVQAANAGGA